MYSVYAKVIAHISWAVHDGPYSVAVIRAHRYGSTMLTEITERETNKWFIENARKTDNKFLSEPFQ